MSSTALSNSKTDHAAALLRHTGASGGVAEVAAGAAFKGRTVAIFVPEDSAPATLSSLKSPSDTPHFAVTGNPATVTMATSVVLETGLHHLQLTEFVTDKAIRAYLDEALRLS